MLTTWTPAHMPEKEEIKERLQTARSQLYDFQMKIKEHKIPVIVLFEGWGASGKGSTIGKVIKNIDPRFFKVATMSSPQQKNCDIHFCTDILIRSRSRQIHIPGFRLDGADLQGKSGGQTEERNIPAD